VRYRAIINPDDDREFAARVEQLATPGLDEPAQLQRLLREAGYPLARVTDGVTEPDGRARWYVYRDGHWRQT
jgi:hypothetical protein